MISIGQYSRIYLDIMEVLRGSVSAEVTSAMAMNHIIQRFLKNISSWSCTTKIFIILHRCLQDTGGLAENMAKELKSKETLLHSYQKKASDDSYEAKMNSDISLLYNTYIKFLYNFKLKSPLLSVRMAEVSQRLKQCSINEIFTTYESFDGLLT